MAIQARVGPALEEPDPLPGGLPQLQEELEGALAEELLEGLKVEIRGRVEASLAIEEAE